jgi:hypothetical protein
VAESGRQSVTETLQSFLENDVPAVGIPGAILGTSASIIENAIAAGLSLQDYVTLDPDKAIKEAEACLAEWLKIQSAAAVSGALLTDGGHVTVNKNMTALIRERVLAAFKQVDVVNELAFTAIKDGEKRREHITRVLYNRAVHKGDTRAMVYLIDRVDGRPAESKVVDLDYDYAFNVYQVIHTLFDKQLEVLNSGNGTKLLCCSRRSGKTHMLVAAAMIECMRVPNTTTIYIGECWAPDTLLRKYDGSLVRADSVVVGDIMMGAASEPQEVLSLGNGIDQMYRIISNRGGIDFTCNSRHILTLRFTRDPLKSRIPAYCQNEYHFEQDKVYDISLDKYIKLPRGAKDALKLYRQTTEYPEQQHIIDPYLLGLWLGDGDKQQPQVAIGREDIDAQEHHLNCLAAEMGNTVTKSYQDRGDSGVYTLYFKGTGHNQYGNNPMLKELQRLDLICNKHIPVEYLIDSVDNRLKLLAGLIDSDGSVAWQGDYQQLFFHNSNKVLFDQVNELTQSLGFNSTYSIKNEWNGTESYNLCIKGELSSIPTRLERKELFDSEGYMAYGFDAVPVGEGPYNGFTLSGNGRCLLADYTVTHNTMEQTEILVDSAANQIIDKCKLRDKKGKRLDWKHFDNGSRILVRGLSNTKDPDQIRGHKAKVIVIDEFFHLKSELLEYLQREVLQPMQMDYADDYKFICSGTPPSIKGTYGEWAWKNWDVQRFAWTFRENPHPVDVNAREEYVERVLHEKGLDWESPFARREYGGEWIYDDDLLLYPEFHTYNPQEALPSFNIDMVLFGIDYGVSDNDTLVGTAWDTAGRRGYIFHEDKFNRLDIKDHSVSQLQYLRTQVEYAWGKALEFFPSFNAKEANKRILWVADDNDQHLTDYFNVNCRIGGEEIRLNIMNAHKTDKVFMFDKIRDLLRTASLLLIQDGKTARECQQTVLKRGINGQVYPEVDDKVYHPDILPALRYSLFNVIGFENEHRTEE